MKIDFTAKIREARTAHGPDSKEEKWIRLEAVGTPSSLRVLITPEVGKTYGVRMRNGNVCAVIAECTGVEKDVWVERRKISAPWNRRTSTTYVFRNTRTNREFRLKSRANIFFEV